MKRNPVPRILALLCTLALLFAVTGCSDTVNTALDIALAVTETDAPAEQSAESDAKQDTVSPTATDAPVEDADSTQDTAPGQAGDAAQDAVPDKDGIYTTKEDVALYLYTYGELPGNFITKKEAEALGWPGGDLRPYAPGKCIGGSYFGNYEGQLPEKKGRDYHECDIDTLDASSRGAKRIIYSNDGLIYYTGDHYETFELLYGEE